jgi:hypothetical protein
MTLTTELAHRHRDGLEVTLLWDAVSNRVWIHLVDDRDQTELEFDVDARTALDAFYHPYVYAPDPAADSLDAPAFAA